MQLICLSWTRMQEHKIEMDNISSISVEDLERKGKVDLKEDLRDKMDHTWEETTINVSKCEGDPDLALIPNPNLNR